MKRTRKYAALDVHQTTTSASVREEGGRVIARTILPTEESAIVELFRGMRGAIQVAFEEGTQAQWLHDLLEPMVDRVIVCDRRGMSRQGSKGDQVDADELSELLRCGTAARGLSRKPGAGHAEGARAHVSERGRGRDAGHAAVEGAVPWTGDQGVGKRRLSPEEPSGVARQASGPRRAVLCRDTLPTPNSTCCGSSGPR
jgi:hypothetical protein